ncbi:MAG: hypothetical protein IJ874_00355 [Ruminococcus sp.]|nr:hypothetical protein [Ruminococcus sp.]
MFRAMWSLTLISAGGLGISGGLYNAAGFGVFRTLGITFMTMLYHFGVRLIVGGILSAVRIDEAFCRRKYFQPLSFEKGLYRRLRVREWKKKAPTYAPEEFDISRHSFQELIIASCRAETVHIINVLISFVPLLFSLKFGSFAVFLLTSLAGAVFDMIFVIIQRFNRPRLVRLAERRTKISNEAVSG